jgi:poly(hydroxyalkanoate) granule-associated protein
MQEELRESAHKIWLAGMGALAVAGEEGKTLFQTLVAKGMEIEDRSKGQVDKVKGKLQDAKAGVGVMLGRLQEGVDEQVSAALAKLGVPTRKEIAALTKRVEELSKAIEKMKKAAAPAPKPKKPAAAPAESAE